MDTSCRVRSHFFRNLLFTSLYLVVSPLSGEYVVLYTVCQTHSALLQAQTNMESTRMYTFVLKRKKLAKNTENGQERTAV